MQATCNARLPRLLLQPNNLTSGDVGVTSLFCVGMEMQAKCNADCWVTTLGSEVCSNFRQGREGVMSFLSSFVLENHQLVMI